MPGFTWDGGNWSYNPAGGLNEDPQPPYVRNPDSNAKNAWDEYQKKLNEQAKKNGSWPSRPGPGGRGLPLPLPNFGFPKLCLAGGGGGGGGGGGKPTPPTNTDPSTNSGSTNGGTNRVPDLTNNPTNITIRPPDGNINTNLPSTNRGTNGPRFGTNGRVFQ